MQAEAYLQGFAHPSSSIIFPRTSSYSSLPLSSTSKLPFQLLSRRIGAVIDSIVRDMQEVEAKLIALGVVLPSLATFFTALRFWARQKRHTKPGIDDVLIVVALCLVWGMGITQIVGRIDPVTETRCDTDVSQVRLPEIWASELVSCRTVNQ